MLARMLAPVRMIVAALVLLAGVVVMQPSPVTAQSPQAAQQLEQLALVTAGGRHVFQVEVMRTPEQRARGLMFRRHLPADRGMLFDFEREEPVAMWMQNTYIPLDMIFIRRDGTIARIAERTEPLSTRTIPSGEPVLGVLEVNGGVAERIGLKPGDRVEHPLFRR
jgi:uncharacterized membrane protein (UPF0127 family)